MEYLRRLWHWWHDIPADPREQVQRASDIVLLAIAGIAINVAILIVHTLIAWKQLQ